MPAFRTFHHGWMRARDLRDLNPFELLVWFAMMHACDDFGVLPRRATLLVEAEQHLDALLWQGRVEEIAAAMAKIEDSGLFVRFECDGDAFLACPRWRGSWIGSQTFAYPSSTKYPCPTEETFAKLSRETSTFFRKFHPNFKSADRETSESTSTTTSTTTATTTSTAAPEAVDADGFMEFWVGYPRKIDKRDARRAWGKVEPRERDAVMRGLAAWIGYWRAKGDVVGGIAVPAHDGVVSVPHPTTWLHKRRWESEPPPLAVRARGGVAAMLGILSEERGE